MKRMKCTKRSISILLTVAMLVSIIASGMVAFAEGEFQANLGTEITSVAAYQERIEYVKYKTNTTEYTSVNLDTTPETLVTSHDPDPNGGPNIVKGILLLPSGVTSIKIKTKQNYIVSYEGGSAEDKKDADTGEYTFTGLNDNCNIDVSSSNPGGTGGHTDGNPQQNNLSLTVGETENDDGTQILVNGQFEAGLDVDHISDGFGGFIDTYTGTGYKVQKFGTNIILELSGATTSIGNIDAAVGNLIIRTAPYTPEEMASNPPTRTGKVGNIEGNANLILEGGVIVDGSIELTNSDLQARDGTINVTGSINVGTANNATLRAQDAILNIGGGVLTCNLKAESNSTITVGTASSKLSDVDAVKATNLDVEYGGKFTAYYTDTNNVNVIYRYSTYLPYSTNVDTNHAARVDCASDSMSETDAASFTFTNESGKYELKSNAKAIRSILWDYSGQDSRYQDAYVTGGTIRVAGARGMSDENSRNEGINGYFVEADSEVRVYLTPNAGYQLTSLSINGKSLLTPESDTSCYKFTMPDQPLHMSVIFEKTENSAVVDSDEIKGAKVVVPDGEIASGTARLTVKDTKLTDDQSKEFAKVAEGYNLGDALDLKLDNIVYKGSADNVWTSNITELDKASTVTLKVSDEMAANLATATTCSVVREHNGKTTLIPATYNAQTKEITFETDGYSTYAIAYEPSVVIEDKDTGVIIKCAEGVLPENAKMEVNEVKDGRSYQLAEKALGKGTDKFALFDISVTADNVKVQPDGTVYVYLPIPEGFDKEKLAVYYINDNGKKEKMKGQAEGDYYVFETTHFSLFALSQDNEKAANTADSTPILGLVLTAVVSAGGLVIIRKKF